MVSPRSLILGCALLTTTLALPTPQTTPTTSNHTCAITASDLTAIDPTTASCTSASATFATECADATRAAPALTSAFAKYAIHSPNVQAALVALMLFESASFKYAHNHFPAPGRPGQGTRNMQMAPFNEKYATDVFGADAVAAAKAGAQGDSSDAVLALVNARDEDSFGSAAWFLTTQCEASIVEGLAAGTEAGWEAYLVDCVGTSHDTARDASWIKAKEVLGA
ncbi:hypothetical protein P171DRAFT_417006 [Karstenula rhodostoma CBS 690.94]|uniref:Pectinesterase inhibitor domain-containing protein n=1 Tax=Karstenula rhodostoma CBS 690.94 TaxID=1392251 RepID=A0A9P4PDP5_9PLEO|nr:hypothetical protein P171DRAFT_417006 [Karstenula rhodostoma CBS 690.94]